MIFDAGRLLVVSGGELSNINLIICVRPRPLTVVSDGELSNLNLIICVRP